ncbi:MAG: DegT/DnrJ/EryC1/StrS aminotransferase family protein [Gemmatimonadota bacterium]|nr:DegT/DnrJ/EryC1/StrS aminotransferase family protein [Gemmatimonadota bacterium]
MIPVSRPSVGEKELARVSEVFDTGWLGMGALVREFEETVGSYLGVEQVVAVNTGTSAIHLALDSLGLAPGDQVIVPSLTFAATIQAVLSTGAEPVFADIDPDTLNITPEDVAQRLTERTRVILPVHYCGSPCDMDELIALAGPRSISLVEDAAHAFGSFYKGRRIGALEGPISCFSFDPIKVITCGEGGAVTTGDPELAEAMRKKRILGIDTDTWSRYQHRRNWFYEVVTEGYRYHMSNISAAIGLEQFKRVEEFISRRQAIVRRYDEGLAGLEGVITLRKDIKSIAPFMYIIRVPGCRDALMDYLKEKGIGTGIHYIPNHLHPLFSRFFNPEKPLPQTDLVFREILTLPLFFELSDRDVDMIVGAIADFFKKP